MPQRFLLRQHPTQILFYNKRVGVYSKTKETVNRQENQFVGHFCEFIPDLFVILIAHFKDVHIINALSGNHCQEYP